VSDEPKKLFCIGLGYVARALAGAAVSKGFSVSGTKRDPGTERYSYVFDGNTQIDDVGAVLAGTTHLLISAPPDAAGDPVLRHHLLDIAACGSLGWIGYLSSTGVYGDRDGGWVDEGTVPEPGSETTEFRLAAEGQWLTTGAMHGIPVQIFRLAGIYGPARNALVQLRAGTARRIVKPGHAFSRIHVVDIVGVLLASMDRPHAGAIYNVCDDEPADQSDVVTHAAELLGIEPPQKEEFANADLSEAARRFYSENRRIDNRRIKQDLGVALAYPTYRDGLAALARDLAVD